MIAKPFHTSNMRRFDRSLACALALLLSNGGTIISSFGFHPSTTSRHSSTSPLHRCRKHVVYCWSLQKPLRRINYIQALKEREQSETTLLAKQPHHTLGVLVLLTVPLAWGTYVPVVRFLYEIQPPVPGLVFSARYYLLASFTLLSLALRPNSNESLIPWPWQAE